MTNLTASVPANNNTNAGILPTVTRDAGTLVYRNIADRDWTQFGRKHTGTVHVGQHAAVEAGKRVVLWGVNTTRTTGLLPYRKQFSVGDSAVYDSYNLIYTGTIVAIGDKTVTVQEDHGSRKHRMSIAEFNRRNWNFDSDYVFKNNTEWRD